jgi:adenylate cyclase
VPVDEDGRLTLNVRGPGHTFDHIPAIDVLEGRVARDRIAGKMILVGITATALVDVRPTAFDGLFPGVEIHATILDNILTGDMLRQPRWSVLLEIAAIFLFTILLGVLSSRGRGLAGALVATACVVGYLAGSQWFFLSSGVPLGLVFPITAIILTYSAINVHHFLTEQAARNRTREAFSRYLNPELARIASENPEALKLGGDKRVLTVLFSDIRGFTSIAEKLEAEPLVEILNTYLSHLTERVFDHDGTLDKYIGDAIMAVWGAPLPQPDHAARACRAALSMVDELRELAELSRRNGWPLLDMGIGLHTGEMVVGNMGSLQHLSYTVVGDNVNLGSRLEGLTKFYDVRVIASEATVAARVRGATERRGRRRQRVSDERVRQGAARIPRTRLGRGDRALRSRAGAPSRRRPEQALPRTVRRVSRRPTLFRLDRRHQDGHEINWGN